MTNRICCHHAQGDKECTNTIIVAVTLANYYVANNANLNVPERFIYIGQSVPLQGPLTQLTLSPWLMQ
jgi:hypothetical protein